MTRITLLVVVLAELCSFAFAQQFTPFVIPAQAKSTSPLSRSSKPIGVDSPRVIARDGHFFLGEDRIRFWGVNTTFGGNLPTHEQAIHIARRLSCAGVNCVRIHHLDTARWPRGIWNSQDGKTIEPQALDRLHYFISQLAEQGVYTNLNLHVGRAHSQYLGLPDPGTNYDKIACIFTPALIDAQKQFATQMLESVNPYRKVRLADDPALAIVEITNENSFFMWDGDERIRAFPEFYAHLLQNQFNSWLRRRYADTDVLARAWAKGTEPMGQNLLRNSDFTESASVGRIPNWSLEQHENARAKVAPDRQGVRIRFDQLGKEAWHLQFNQSNLAVNGGRYYTVRFAAASDSTRTLSCAMQMDHAPWTNLGLAQTVTIGPKLTSHTFGFTCSTTDTKARISFSLGDSTAPIHLADVELRPGGQHGLLPGEDPRTNSVAVFPQQGGTARTMDRMQFLVETEKTFFDSMRDHVRGQIGCKAMVTGTIVFGPAGLYAQSGMDFIDAHAYWKHPNFPHKPWDMGDWTVDQVAMTDRPAGATLFGLACERLDGKPFTVTEYNHPAPNDFQAECVPLLASFAAAQDWDGVWMFDYGNSPDVPDPQRFRSFFDIEANPSKWGFMRAGAAVFRDAGVTPLAAGIVAKLASRGNPVPQVCQQHLQHDSMRRSVEKTLEGARVSWEQMLGLQVKSSFDPAAPGGWMLKAGVPPPSIQWSTSDGRGFYSAKGKGAWVFVGHAKDFATSTGGALQLTSPEFASVTVTALDSRDMSSSKRVLVAACGKCENTNMDFSDDRRTVGKNWGTDPVRIETVSGTLTIPGSGWRCNALSPKGTPGRQVTVNQQAGNSIVQLSPVHETMWYLLTRDETEHNQARRMTQLKRFREYGFSPGTLPTGSVNKITDVNGVLVGHLSKREGERVRTGITLIDPGVTGLYHHKLPAAVAVGNGYGKLTGVTQINELGTLETPIALTNTLAVGPVLHGLVELVLRTTGDIPASQTVNGVVGETNDGVVNDIHRISLSKEDVTAAYESRTRDFDLGSVGAGTGTSVFKWKGGIGSASRLVTIENREFVVGALLQTNFGGDLTIMGIPVGRLLQEKPRRAKSDLQNDGSCMIVLATDAPLSSRQLGRLARRAMLGLGLTGSVLAHSSGDYAVAFSTDRSGVEGSGRGDCLPDGILNPLFLAVVEAVEESVYDSLFMSETVTGRDGNTLQQIPTDEVARILKEHGL